MLPEIMLVVNILGSGEHTCWRLADAGPEAVSSASFVSAGATYAILRSDTTWHVNANTPKSWAGTSQTFQVVLADGSVHKITIAFR